MLVLPPRVIPQLAERIKHAYLRRRPRLHREYARSGVWSAAAETLVAAHAADSTLPIDPELFVATQFHRAPAQLGDPWSELVQPAAARRYRHRVRHIVKALRKELRAELQLIARRLDAGMPWDEVLGNPCSRLSPLARYIATYRRHGADACEGFRDAARRQHDACPLYRQACLTLLPDHAYPVLDLVPGIPRRGNAGESFRLN